MHLSIDTVEDLTPWRPTPVPNPNPQWALAYVGGRLRGYARGGVTLENVCASVHMAMNHGVSVDAVQGALSEYGVTWDPRRDECRLVETRFVQEGRELRARYEAALAKAQEIGSLLQSVGHALRSASTQSPEPVLRIEADGCLKVSERYRNPEMHTGRWPTTAEILQVIDDIQDVKRRRAELDAKLDVVRDMPPTVTLA